MQLKNFLASFETEVKNPWTNVYGVSRSLIAFGTLLTLVFNDIQILVRPTGIQPSDFAFINVIQDFSLFAIFPGHLLIIGEIISIAVLLLVLVGYRPKLTGILHWYVTASFSNAALLINGGDQIASILTLLLIPVTLFDNRKWHWKPSEKKLNTVSKKSLAIISNSCLMVIKLQMFVIYFMAGTGKLDVTQWLNGTALYYWFNHSAIGLVDWMYPLFEPIITHGLTITILTWSAILVELLLAAGIFIKDKYKIPLLYLGISFHFFIAITMGLINFLFIMSGGLILYLYPNTSFRLDEIISRFKKKMKNVQIKFRFVQDN